MDKGVEITKSKTLSGAKVIRKWRKETPTSSQKEADIMLLETKGKIKDV